MLSYTMMVIQFFFIVQMSYVNDALHSETPQQLSRKTRIRKGLFAITLILHMYTLSIAILYILEQDSLSSETNRKLEISEGICILLVNGYMMGQAAFYIFRFGQMKAASLRLEGLVNPYR